MVGNECNVKLADEWREILAAKADSGLTVAAFCQERGIVEHRYYYWQRRLNGKQRRRKVVENTVPSEGFVELVRTDSAGSGVTVRLPNLGGVEIVLAPGFDGATLQKLVELLRKVVA